MVEFNSNYVRKLSSLFSSIVGKFFKQKGQEIITHLITSYQSRDVTIKKWRDSEPNRNSHYALIAKEWPTGSYGKFDSIRNDIKRAWICEEETGVIINFIFNFLILVVQLSSLQVYT